jgi:hypothetical protein
MPPCAARRQVPPISGKHLIASALIEVPINTDTPARACRLSRSSGRNRCSNRGPAAGGLDWQSHGRGSRAWAGFAPPLRGGASGRQCVPRGAPFARLRVLLGYSRRLPPGAIAARASFRRAGLRKKRMGGANERQASAGAKARRLISGVCGTRPRGYPGRALSKTDIHRKLLGPGLAAGSLEANWALKFRDLCGDSDSGAAHSQEALASSGLTRSRNSLEGLK